MLQTLPTATLPALQMPAGPLAGTAPGATAETGAAQATTGFAQLLSEAGQHGPADATAAAMPPGDSAAAAAAAGAAAPATAATDLAASTALDASVAAARRDAPGGPGIRRDTSLPLPEQSLSALLDQLSSAAGQGADDDAGGGTAELQALATPLSLALPGRRTGIGPLAAGLPGGPAPGTTNAPDSAPDSAPAGDLQALAATALLAGSTGEGSTSAAAQEPASDAPADALTCAILGALQAAVQPAPHSGPYGDVDAPSPPGGRTAGADVPTLQGVDDAARARRVMARRGDAPRRQTLGGASAEANTQHVNSASKGLPNRERDTASLTTTPANALVNDARDAIRRVSSPLSWAEDASALIDGQHSASAAPAPTSRGLYVAPTKVGSTWDHSTERSDSPVDGFRYAGPQVANLPGKGASASISPTDAADRWPTPHQRAAAMSNESSSRDGSHHSALEASLGVAQGRAATLAETRPTQVHSGNATDNASRMAWGAQAHASDLGQLNPSAPAQQGIATTPMRAASIGGAGTDGMLDHTSGEFVGAQPALAAALAGYDLAPFQTESESALEHTPSTPRPHAHGAAGATPGQASGPARSGEATTSFSVGKPASHETAGEPATHREHDQHLDSSSPLGAAPAVAQPAAMPDGAGAGAAPPVSALAAPGPATEAAPAAEAQLLARPDSPAFAAELGATITTFVRDGVDNARLELNPADMGPVTVQIQLDGTAAQVHLFAEHAGTRQALEQAMPSLAGSLSEAGLTLTGGGVFQQPQQPREQGASRDGEAQTSRRAAARPDAAPLAGIGAAAPTAARPRGVVDLVA